MASYLKQLSADLPRWVEQGLVTAENAPRILRDAQENLRQGWFRLPLILSMLGGLLVFVGVISLFASGWDDIPRLLRVLVLLGTMAGCFAAAQACREKGSDGLGHGLAFLGLLMFGANLMLIAQMYHLPPNPPGGAFLWLVGAGLVALLWPSQLAMAPAFALAGIWSWFTVSAGAPDALWGLVFSPGRAFHWPFLAVWGVLAAVSVKRGYGKALHMAGLTLSIWAFQTSFAFFDDDIMRFAGLMLAVMLLVLAAAGEKLAVIRPGAGTVSRYLWAAFGFWFLLASAPDLFDDLLVRSALPPPPALAGMTVFLALVAAGGLWAVWTDRLRPAAAALATSALMVVLTLLSGFYVTAGSHALTGPAGLIGALGAIAASVLLLALALGGIIHGTRAGVPFFINLGFTFFALKLIWLYFDTVWGLAARAPFFILGGLLVIGLGIAFDRHRRKLIATMGEHHAG